MRSHPSRRRARSAAALLVLSALGFAASPAPKPTPKVDICHVTPHHVNLITVSSNAKKAHDDHGDHDPYTVYTDADGDGVGDSNSPRNGVCTTPSGFSTTSGDCDDANPDVAPGLTEVPGNGVDDDCDASTPDLLRTWDAAADWGPSNPNGEWSYGYVNASGDWVNFPGWVDYGSFEAWYQYGFFWVYANPHDEVAGHCGDWCLQPHSIALHPPAGEPVQTSIRFTAPEDGHYRIEAAMSPIDAQILLVRAIVSGPAGVIASQDLTALGDTLTVDEVVTLQAGESILFSVDRVDDWFNDGTRLDAVITKVG